MRLCFYLFLRSGLIPYSKYCWVPYLDGCLTLLGLALPFTPTIAISHKDRVGSVNIGPGIIRRAIRIRCSIPGTGIQNLEDTSGMAVVNRLGVCRSRVETGLTLGNAHS